MSVETFNYPDGGVPSSLPNSQVRSGEFSVLNKKLATPSTTVNSRLVWDSLSDGVFEHTFSRDDGVGGYVGIVFREEDSDNYWQLYTQISNGRTRVVKFTNGSPEKLKESYMSYDDNKARLKVVAIGSEIKAYADDVRILTVNDEAYMGATSAGVRLDGVGLYAESVSTPSLPVEYHSGKALSLVNKLGILYNNHSMLANAEATEEFWPHPLATDRIPNWPYAQYPLIIYSSTDHSTGSGGVFARVWDSSVGLMTDPNAWFEWNQVSDRAEFSHITKKSEPIYTDPDFNQTETPTVSILDGTLHMFYHCTAQSNPTGDYGMNAQNTHSATGTNGIDFVKTHDSVVTYNNKWEQGDGHTGYLNITVNPMSHLPYQYLANTTHGGGDFDLSPAQAIWGTNDLVNFERLYIWGRPQGELIEFVTGDPENWIWVLLDVNSIVQDGNYWRMIVVLRPDIKTGGADNGSRPVEVLIDDNFNIVAAPNEFISLGDSGSYDELELHHFKELPFDTGDGKRYGTYKGLAGGDVTSCGICEIEDIDHDWRILYSHQNRTVEKSYSAISDFTADTTISVREDGMLEQVVPFNSSAKWTADTITLSDYAMVDIVFKRHGRAGTQDMSGVVGLFDDVDNPTNQLSLVWPNYDDGRNRIMLRTQNLGEEVTEEATRKVVGVIGRGFLSDGVEDPRSAHTYGIRVIPEEKLVYALDGVSRTTKHYLYDFDFDQPLTLASKFVNPSTDTDDAMRMDGVEVVSYNTRMAESVNNRPTAVITGSDIDYAPNSTVPLVCEASDLDGDTLTYLWEQLDNGAPTITISNPALASTSFLAEAEDANILVRCTVSDGQDSAVANATFYITEGSNSAPTASITLSQETVTNGGTFTADGSGSTDSDGTIVSYLWEQVDNGAGTVVIDSPTESFTQVTAPNDGQAHTIQLRLTIEDDDGAKGSLTVSVEVEETPNVAPTANAGPTQSVIAGARVILDSSLSSDEDGTIAARGWVQVAGDEVTLDDANAVRPEFIAPSKNEAQRLSFDLVVIDDEGNASDPVTVHIDVAAVEQNNVLNIIDKLNFTLDNDGIVTAYPGRANRETFRFKPSSTENLILDDEGYLDLSKNDIQRVEVSIVERSSVQVISSHTDAIIIDISRAHCRLGDLDVNSTTKAFDLTFVAYIGSDTKGVVLVAPSQEGNVSVKYYYSTIKTIQ